jgi:uncharacterized membrane protein
MPKRWQDDRIERIIGTLLRTGVILAAAVVVTGAAIFLMRHGAERPDYRVFRGEPSELRSARGIVAAAVAGGGRATIQLGLLLLIATPVARVIFSVAGFALERDRPYVLMTLLVLAILLFSLAGGHL